ncbi:MAG: methyltransferase domain-containing protein [Chloroflexota bacterium]|nr:methyltransferase domain-containing protein [Chloroflexota bacterium]
MNNSLFNILVDPITKSPLQVQGDSLCSAENMTYKIIDGIPRFVLTEDSGQKQTEASFGYKWQQESSYDTPEVHASARAWLVARYGFGDVEAMRTYFAGRTRILDAGCGSGFSASLWMTPDWYGAEWIGADISAAIDVAQKRLAGGRNRSFVQADILQLPFRTGAFDTIFSEGVLHHTPSTERALKSLVPLLSAGGELMFYVYRKKSPIREFTDDHIRAAIADLAPEDAWAAMRPLTKLGQALAELHAEVDVAEDIPYLGIQAGRYDVQRLIYWHIAKLFWNETFAFEANNHVNFDWYAPRYAHRQTEAEVRRWCAESNLTITHFDAQEAGFTVRAIKQA